MNDRATLVRNAVTFPSSTFISIFTTSATRKSRIEVAAVSTARRPASSQDGVSGDQDLTDQKMSVWVPSVTCSAWKAVAHATRAMSRSLNFWILPVEVFGISTNNTRRGIL